MTLASWNVNSIKARLANVTAWIKSFKPDVLLLQELKCQEESFPVLEIRSLGYRHETVGQKSYNGVAVLSTEPIAVRERTLPGDETDSQARYLEVETHGLVAASIYLPNGNPVASGKFGYKLAWMGRLARHAEALLREERVLVLGGDYNVIPQAEDCYDPQAWQGDALFRPESRQAFRTLVNLGFTEAYRQIHPKMRDYTFWDYQGGAWQNDLGVRIDHLLLSPQAADRLADCGIDRRPRGADKASDHTPIWCRLDR
ncbi:MAG: exodeoxyribonuclease III [Rhodospirillales bacterium]|nr:exodeoxyribonuclease III [Rhodospirillales bacterium]